MKHVIVGLGMAVSFIGVAGAASYTGTGPGTSTIDADGSGDYPSLAAAVAAINLRPLTGGDWTFLIASDMTETSKLALGQRTNGNKIIFKPAPDTQPTITFNTQETTTSGWGGHFIIGTASKSSSLSNIETDNVIIDGSNDGTTTRSLTIRNTLNANSAHLLSVVADSDGFEMRNCNLVVNTNGSAAALRLASINQSTFVNSTPDNAIIQNCSIIGTGPSSSCIAIERNGGGTNTTGSDNILITGNDLLAEMRGVIVADYRRITITNNKIALDSVAGTGSPSAITFGTGSTSTEQVILTIENNEILRVRRALNDAYSVHGIVILGTFPSQAPGPIVSIRNNSIGGLAVSSTSATPTLIGLAGIRTLLPRQKVTIVNNSVNAIIPPNYTVTGGPTVNGGIIVGQTDGNSVIDIRNNIVRYDAPLGYCIARVNTEGRWTVDSNTYFNSGGSLLGLDGVIDRATFAEWQEGTSFDATSVIQDPFAAELPIAGVWTSDENLRFTAPAGPAFRGVHVDGILTDVDGVVRDLEDPYKGAFEGRGYADDKEGWFLS